MGVNLTINFTLKFEIILCGLNLFNHFDTWGLHKKNDISFLKKIYKKKYDKIAYKKTTLYLKITLCDIIYFKSKQNTDNWVYFIP